MKKLFLSLLVVVLFSCSLNKQVLKSIDACNNQILPEYKEYISHDASLSPDSKRIRLSTVNELDSLVKSSLKKGDEK